MFYKRGKLNVSLEKYEEAIRDFNWATSIRPDYGESFYLRGWCRHKLGNNYRACQDLSQAVKLGYSKARKLSKDICK
nr:tetratricopeptide repeat protein [Fulvivirga sp. M361]